MPRSGEWTAPCSNAQEGLWLMESAYELGSAYAIEVTFSIIGELRNVLCLERAIASVIVRHDCSA